MMAANMNVTSINRYNLPFGQQQQDTGITGAGIVAIAARDSIRDVEKNLDMKPSPATNESDLSIKRFSSTQASDYVKNLIEGFAAKIEKQIYEDPLTGLLNRRAYQRDRVKTFIKACQEQEPISVLTFDLDKFKSYNDEYGHDAGDVALKQFGRVVKETLGKAGKAYRVGGEELRAIVVGKSSEEAFSIAENIRKELKDQTTALKESGDLQRTLTVSIGVSTYKPTQEDQNAGDLFNKDTSKGFRDLFERSFARIEKLSDEACYVGKGTGRHDEDKGRDRVVVKLPDTNYNVIGNKHKRSA